MSIRLIVKDPDPVLRERAIEVTKFNANLHKLLKIWQRRCMTLMV